MMLDVQKRNLKHEEALRPERGWAEQSRVERIKIRTEKGSRCSQSPLRAAEVDLQSPKRVRKARLGRSPTQQVAEMWKSRSNRRRIPVNRRRVSATGFRQAGRPIFPSGLRLSTRLIHPASRPTGYRRHHRTSELPAALPVTSRCRYRLAPVTDADPIRRTTVVDWPAGLACAVAAIDSRVFGAVMTDCGTNVSDELRAEHVRCPMSDVRHLSQHSYEMLGIGDVRMGGAALWGLENFKGQVGPSRRLGCLENT
ncbi:hypothetical protein AXG93_3556s1190 [Marchantia polymorpha subsp. ruderalis]|uniref:Uncharacterized protein n=1 Tax=Marchantia polymorpha subsp. ruderalis TaxID=1480154 RepID=A0A176WI84_MARPO|nr:hypothetical protein AXG93_3556s1190 [Marchantia polymorpha subsp. ruderalis]